MIGRETYERGPWEWQDTYQLGSCQHERDRIAEAYGDDEEDDEDECVYGRSTPSSRAAAKLPHA